MKKQRYHICSLLIIAVIIISPCLSYAKVLDNVVDHAVKAGFKKGVTGGSSAVLASRIGVASMRGWAAHHAIPVQLKNHRTLQKVSFDLDNKINGIGLPTKAGMDPILPIHAGSHPNYTAAVARDLDKIPENLSEEQTLKEIEKVIKKFKGKLKSGTPLHNQEGLENPWK